MKFKSIHKLVVSLVSIAVVLAPALRAQSKASSLRGYSASQARTETEWEQKMRATPKPELLREYVKHLSAEPHHVGSSYDKQNAEFILNKFRSWGLKADIEEFDVLFPTPKERVVEMIEPERFRAELKEPAIPEDPDSNDANQLPTYNAYSGEGDVTSQLVYVNYGVPADYETLEKLGVDVRGKIVIARYGGSWRGIKPKVAYEHGAIGCLIYSDPRDDGYFQGDVYPQGPYRPMQGVQRGSVMDMPVHSGDPLTPGWGATKGAKRIKREDAEVIMKIPVLPISYGDALPLLRALRGPVAPEQWRGALPITYHIGPGAARVHLKATFDWGMHTLYDVVARIEGSEAPDQWIVYGNHHDAWVNGADDPVSGMATVMEVARSLGELTKQGWKPKRTIIICAWDGEEPALLGSTEWVETHADELKDKAVLYVNSDSTSKGFLNVGGSHSLERFANEVARDVNDPTRNKSVLSSLKGRRIERARTDEDRKEAQERPDLRIEALGSGSDYTPFLQHLGIASLNTGFGGEGGGGVYHSIYDSFTWYTKFGDPTFEYGRALAQLNGTVVMRMADAEVLPFEFTNLSDTIAKYIEELKRLAKTSGREVDFTALKNAQRSLDESARRYEEALTKAPLDAMHHSRGLNDHLYKSERKLTNERGLPRRPWFVHQLYAPGFYTGYGVKTIPGVREAIEEKHWNELEPQMKDVVAALTALRENIDAATKILQNRE